MSLLQSLSLPENVLSEMKVQDGRSVLELSADQSLLLVFLRHFGCPFCREALADIRDQRETLEANGVELVLVHMVSESRALEHLRKFQLQDLHRVSDIASIYYEAFGIKKASLGQLLSPYVFLRAFFTSIMKGHLPGKPEGDWKQMPGMFLVNQGNVISGHKHDTPADRPNIAELFCSSAH